MPSPDSPQWHEKASSFFSSSGVRLTQAGQSAGTFVGEVVKDTSENVADVAERVGLLVKKRWGVFQQASRQPEFRENVQECLRSAATSTGSMLKKGLLETKDKVAVGKIKLEEAAKKTAHKSKSILSNIERWQKGVASDDVFGIPIEVTVQRQQTKWLIPHILIKCADFLILKGLHTEYLFKAEGEKRVIQHLISLFNHDWNASLPEDVNPINVAALIKCYLASLPEPLVTFELYNEIRDAQCSVRGLRDILNKLPNVRYTTLEFVTSLLLRVSQKSSVNKMGAALLSIEIAPLIIWQKGVQRSDISCQLWRSSLNESSNGSSKTKNPTAYNTWDTLLDEEGLDANCPISLDDYGLSTDYAAIEVVQCIIEHHNAIFTDANETIWR